MNLIDKKVFKIYTEQNAESETNDLILTFNNEAKLSKSERIVFNTLSHFAEDNVLNLSQLNGQLSSEHEAKWFMEKIENWEESVKNSINSAEYFDDTGSTLITIISGLGLLFGIVIGALGLFTNLGNGFYALLGGVFLVIFSIVLMRLDDDIFGRWTESGRTFYLKWGNFKKFLKDNSLINEHPPESIVIWNKYLVYGTALGVADEVYKAMKLNAPSTYDDDYYYYSDIYRFHSYAGLAMMHSAFDTGISAANPSSGSGGIGNVGGGSGGGGGGAF